MSKKKSGMKKFALGALIGAGIGMLFAPKKGNETRAILKEKLNSLVDKAKNFDKEDVKIAVENKVIAIQEAINDLDAETVLKNAKSKAKKLQSMVNELGNYVLEKSVPATQKTVELIKAKTTVVIDDVLTKLEK